MYRWQGGAVDDPRTGVLAEAARRLADPAEAARLLDLACRSAGLTLIEHRLRTVHRRTGRSVSHVFAARIAMPDGERDALLVAHADTRPLPPGAFVVAGGPAPVAVWRFPHDPFLPGLPSAIDVERVGALLDRLGHPSGPLVLRTRSYRPSRRAVVEVADAARTASAPPPVLYLKVLAGAAAAGLADRHRQLAAHAPVPRVVGVDEALGIVALEALAGSTLRATVVEGGALVEPAALVELSTRLAGSGLVSDRSPRAFADPTRHVALLAELAPDTRATVERIADEVLRVDGPPVVVHGDLHAGQVLVSDGAITGLLDVDGSGRGLLAHDAGTLVAYLQVLGEVNGEDDPPVTGTVRERCATYAAAVADAYRPVVGRAPLARATAGAWLALATTAQRGQGPGWEATMRGRIARAAAALDGIGRR
jgi:hypothetical protein